eukprot:gene10741-12529_t
MSAIGFIGVGIMGKGMLKNLATKLDATFVIWNRNQTVCQEIADQFPNRITIANTPADVVKACDVIYSMLSTVEASISVFDEPETGVIAGVSAGKLIAEQIAARGGKFLEAPVSGSKVPAETGTLIFLCGGDAEVFESQAAALDAMGKAKFLLGPVGQGTRIKLVVNMIMGTMMGALAEGLTLSKSADISPEILLQVLDLGAMANPMFKGKGPGMVAGSFPTNFPLKHAQKDMRLALELAEQNNVSLPTTAAANAVYVKAMEECDAGDQDFSAVIQAYQK